MQWKRAFTNNKKSKQRKHNSHKDNIYDTMSDILSYSCGTEPTITHNLAKWHASKTLWHALCSISCGEANSPNLHFRQ